LNASAVFYNKLYYFYHSLATLKKEKPSVFLSRQFCASLKIKEPELEGKKKPNKTRRGVAKLGSEGT
jgi:hypothetical protein